MLAETSIITAMLANEVHLGFNSMFSVRPQVQAGRLRWIAMTASKRSATVDLPTVAESGLPGYEVNQWYGVTTSTIAPESTKPRTRRAAMVHARRH